MASTWITTRTTSHGERRHRVMFRVGGRESTPRYAGSFRTQREALERRAWVAGELAARRVPDLRSLEQTQAPTVAQACTRWRETRVDVTEGTRVLHRVALARVTSVLGQRRIDDVSVDDVNELVTTLAAAGKKRETIRKSVKYLAAVLDDHGIEPNPARGKRVRLPHEEQLEVVPPTSEHVEQVARLLPPAYRLALLWLDWSGARVKSVDTVLVGDYDEQARRIRLRAVTQKTRAALWIELPDALAEAIERALPPREDRDPDAAVPGRRGRPAAHRDRPCLPSERRSRLLAA